MKNTESEKIISFLEKSDDILRDIFQLSGFKKYIPLSSYLTLKNIFRFQVI